MTGNAAIDKIILIASATVSMLTLGLMLYAHMGIKRPVIDAQAELDSMIGDAKMRSQLETVSLKKITLNLYSRSSRLRYLDIQLDILPFQASQAAEINKYEALISDTIINIAGDMEADDLNSVSGKIILEDRIKKNVNTVVGKPLLKKIYFSRFVIQ